MLFIGSRDGHLHVFNEQKEKFVKKIGEKLIELSICDLGIILVTDRTYNIYTPNLDFRIVDLQDAKMVVNCGKMAMISSGVSFFSFDEELSCSLKQRKLIETNSRINRLIKLSPSLICYSARCESVYTVAIYNIHTASEIASIECEKVECLGYWEEFNCIYIGGKGVAEGYLEFYTTGLEKIVKHEFPLEVTCACGQGNLFVVAASYILFCLEVSDLNTPVHVASYKTKNRVNDMAFNSLKELVVAVEGEGILVFVVEPEAIQVRLWSRTHSKVKSVKCVENYAIGIGIEGRLDVIDTRNDACNNIDLGRGGRATAVGSIFRQNIREKPKDLVIVGCLNGEILEVEIGISNQILGICRDIYQACETEGIIENENSHAVDFNLVQYYYKLQDQTKAILNEKHTDIEKAIKSFS